MTDTLKRYDVVGKLLDYEEGRLEQHEVVELFQHLVDTGIAWQLQGHYGRAATTMLREGLVVQK